MTTICTAGKDIHLDQHDVGVLAAELRAISEGSESMRDAGAFAARLVGNAAVGLDDHERFVVLRATDHLRNLTTATPTLIELRDHISLSGNQRWLSYTLDLHDGTQPTEFTSYSGEYITGDRLVTPFGEELRITNTAGEVLVVSPWSRPA